MAATTQKRQPAHVEMVGGRSNRQRIWDVLRQKNDVQLQDIASLTDVDMATVRTYVRSLVVGGYVQQLTRKRLTYHTNVYRLINDVGLEAPRVNRQGKPVKQGLITEQLWRTMRMLRGDFNYHELAALAATDQVMISVTAAKSYIKHLLRAGYLMQITPRQALGGNGGAIAGRYRLNPAKNHGPAAPMVQRTKSIYDPNLGAVVWSKTEGGPDDA